jgi:phytoene synthase
MYDLYSETSFACSKLITERYSTSFTLGIKTLGKAFHQPVYAIYGFVRYADEIVDTFHGYDKAVLLARFRADTYRALEEKISLNPVLHSFQQVVHTYGIERELIDAFFASMAMDLEPREYNQPAYETYIYGSAEVIGLMCLRVFCQGDEESYQRLKRPARRLGAAFQKVNFLRDMGSDYQERGRTYFPGVNFTLFSTADKQRIEKDIEADFAAALEGIRLLPAGARKGVYLAYVYYLKLFQKICKASPQRILHERLRLPNPTKYLLLFKAFFKNPQEFYDV